MILRALLCSMFLAVAGCGSDFGDPCETLGSTEECGDNAICSTPGSSGPGGSSLTCRKICTEDAQCTSGRSCLAVPQTSVKSCQPN